MYWFQVIAILDRIKNEKKMAEGQEEQSEEEEEEDWGDEDGLDEDIIYVK